MKTCTKCGESKPLSEFYRHKNAPDGLSWWCKDCQNASSRKWEQEHPEEARAMRRKLKREKRFADKGITERQFRKMLRAQKNRCAGCRVKIDESCHIDHCHRTGVVRGLLCPTCNRALGLLGDDPKVLRRLAAYLTAAEA